MACKQLLQRRVRLLLTVVLFLTIIGLVFIYSASSVYAAEHFSSSFYFFKKQLLFLIPSILAFCCCGLLPLSFWKKHAPLLFFLSLVLMVLTFIPSMSVKVHGARRWLNVFGFIFQPSEVLKFALFLYLAFFFDRKQEKITSFFQSYVPFLMILGVSCLLLLKQPDFGTTVTVFITSLILFFVAEFRLLHLTITLACAFPLAIAAILLKSYRLNRILIFLNPWKDPQGRGYQIIQSLIAIGSGSLWGVGIANSKQKFFYLPMQHSDFIFSIIAEETGFVGSCFVLLLYVLFCFFGIKIAASLQDPFAFFITLSFVLLISLQAAINLMVVCGLLPTKGFGLPFISYGGTALVINYCMIGLIVNCVRSQK